MKASRAVRFAGAFVVVGIALAFIAAAWGETFAPAARASDGFFAKIIDGRHFVVTYVAPRYAQDPLGPRVGDIQDFGQLNLASRARLEFGADDGLRVPVERSGQRAYERIRVAPRETASPYLPYDGVTAVEATVAIAIFAVLLLLRPSLGTVALFYYGCASIDVTPVLRELGALPDPAFGAVAFVLFAGIYELPAFALLLFLTRFPTPPSTKGSRLRMHLGDVIVIVAAIACTGVALAEPATGAWRGVHVTLGVLGTLLGLLFGALAYCNANGETRQRIGWVIVGLAVSDVAYLVYNVIDDLSLTQQRVWIEAAMELLALALPIALAYAVWRHRVLDVAFALNRAAVFTTMSAILVGVFGGLQWTANALVQRTTHPQSFLIQLIIALILLYVFRIARTSTEGFVSHTLFAARRRRIERIAAIADEVDALSNPGDVAAFVEAQLGTTGISAALNFADEAPSVSRFVAEQLRTFELRVRGRVRGELVVFSSPSEADLAPDEVRALEALASRVVIAREDMLAEALRARLVGLPV